MVDSVALIRSGFWLQAGEMALGQRNITLHAEAAWALGQVLNRAFIRSTMKLQAGSSCDMSKVSCLPIGKHRGSCHEGGQSRLWLDDSTEPACA